MDGEWRGCVGSNLWKEGGYTTRWLANSFLARVSRSTKGSAPDHLNPPARAFFFPVRSPTMARFTLTKSPMAEKKAKTPRAIGSARRRRKPAGTSTGLTALELQAAAPPAEVASLHQAIQGDGGKVLAAYREPFGGQWVVFAALPIELVEPTPFQRNLSDAHVRKLETVIGKIRHFLRKIRNGEVGMASSPTSWSKG